MPKRLPGTALALGIAGLSKVVLMSAMNFVLHSDFRWVLLLPAVCWVVGALRTCCHTDRSRRPAAGSSYFG